MGSGDLLYSIGYFPICIGQYDRRRCAAQDCRFLWGNQQAPLDLRLLCAWWRGRELSLVGDSSSHPIGRFRLCINKGIRGKIFAQFETKKSFLITVILFEVGSAVCGAAPTMNALIVGRTICGIGGSGIYLGAINLLSNSTTEAERPGYLGFVGLTWGIGTV